MAGMNLKVGVQDKELDNLLLKIQRLQKELAKIDIHVDPEGFKELDDQLKKAMYDFEVLYVKINEAKFKPAVDVSDLVKMQDEILKMREMLETKVVMPSTPEGSDMNHKIADTTKELNQKTTEYLNQQAALSQEAKKLANDVLGSYGQNIKLLSKIEGELKTVTAAKNLLNKSEKDGLISTQEAIKERSTLINRELQLKSSKNELQATVRNEIKQMQTAEGSIQSMALQLTRLQNTYDNLNASERNSAQGKGLLANIKQTEQEFLKLNQTMNAGKIMSSGAGFNTLGFSVQQIARELPSLTMGAQMFFLAISNNLPILSDELKKAKVNYNALVSEGKTAIPVWKQVVSSIFSWQTAMVVGITLLTMYGKEIGNWIKGLFGASKANEELAKSLDEINKSYSKAILEGSKNAQKELTNLNLLYKASQNDRKSKEERKKAVDELQKQYPAYFKNLTDEQILAGKGSDAYIRLSNSIIASARARAAADKITENESKILDLEIKNIEALDKRKQAEINKAKAESSARAITSNNTYVPAGQYVRPETGYLIQAERENDAIKEQNQAISDNVDQINALNKANERLAKNINISDLTFEVKTSDGKANKSRESAAEKMRESSLKLLNFQSELDSESVKQQLEHEQKLLDIEQDSFDKRYRQNQLNMAKEIVSTEDLRQKMIKDQQEAAKNIYIKNKGSDTEFNFATFDKTLLPQGLSDADIEAQIKKRTDASLAAWKKGNEDIAKEQKAFSDEEKLTFASQLDQQIYSIRSHYKERRDLAKGNEGLIKQINDNESKEIIAARLQFHQRQLEADADYNQKYQQLIEDRFVFESDKQKASLEQQIKDQKNIFNDLEKQVLNDPNNNELANQLRDALIRLRLLNKELEKTPAQKLGEIAGVFNQISSGLSDITGVDFSMIGNSLSGIASFASGDYLGAATSGFSIISGFVSGIISQKEQEAVIQSEINKLQQQYNIDLRQQNYDLISSIDYARTFRDNLEALQWLVEKGFISNVDYSAWEALIAQAKEADKNMMAAQQNYDKALSQGNTFLDEAYRLRNEAIWDKFKDITEDWKNGIIDTEEALRRIDVAGGNGFSDIADRIARADEETQKWKDEMAELSSQMDEFATGTSFDGFLNDAANAITDLRENVTSLADFTEEKLTNAILSSFKYQILSNALKPMYNELADMLLSGNYDDDTVNDWKQRLIDILNTNSKELDKIFNEFGIDPKEVGSSQTPSSGYSVSMSQDTGDKIVGIATGSQMRLISIDENVARIAQWNQPVSEKFNFDTIVMPLGVLSQSSLRIERMIEENRNIAISSYYELKDINKQTKELYPIRSAIDSMNSKLDNI